MEDNVAESISLALAGRVEGAILLSTLAPSALPV